MLVCCNCQYHWTFRETMHSLVSLKLNCPACQKELYISVKSRIRTYLVTLSTLYLQLYFYIFQIDSAFIFVVNIFISMFLIMVLPSFYELSMEEEPLWRPSK